MDKYKTIIYFRGKCYKNSLYNRVIAHILSFSYRLKLFFVSFFISVFLLNLTSCNRSYANIGGYFYTDTLYTDSFGTHGHSYIRFRVPHSTNFQIVHNPDCYCRYHRTFVVIKRK